MAEPRTYTTGEVIEILMTECGLTHRQAKELMKEYREQQAELDLEGGAES